MRSVQIGVLLTAFTHTAATSSQPANKSSTLPYVHLAPSVLSHSNATNLTSSSPSSSVTLASLQASRLVAGTGASATATNGNGGVSSVTPGHLMWHVNSTVAEMTNTTSSGLQSHRNETTITSFYTLTGHLDYVLDSAPPKFVYETTEPANSNWIAFFPDGAGPGMEGDDSYVGWQAAPDAKGNVIADQKMDQCLEAGKYEAYLLKFGNRAELLAGPVIFDYPGNSQFQKCSDGKCIPAGQSCGADTLSYVADSAPPKFVYETTEPANSNWIAFFPDGAGPGMGGDDSYVGWQTAPGAEGNVTADQNMDQCLEAGEYEAYLLRYGYRDKPLAGPISFEYPGDFQFQKCDDGRCIQSGETCGCPDSRWECGDQCISEDELCNGQCPFGRKKCRGKCIDDVKICDDICDNPEPGLNWRFDKYLDGNGPGRIGSNHWFNTRTYGPDTVDLDYTFSGPPVASIKGTTHAIGWKGGCGEGTASIYNQPLPSFQCVADTKGVVGTGCGGKAAHFVLHHTGYFVPQFSGRYTFAFANADDVAYMWLGPDAISNYTMANYRMFVDHVLWPKGQTKAEYEFDAEEGVAVPIRVAMVASWGDTRLTFTVKNPNGQIIMQSPSGPNVPPTRVSREFVACFS